MFESLGLGSEAETTYLHLVRHGPATLHQLTRQLRRPASRLTALIDELRQLGLLYTTTQPDDPVVAVPLAMGADHLISQREHELKRLRHTTDQLVAQLTTHADRSRPDLIEVINGADDVTSVIHRMHCDARERLRLLVPDPAAHSLTLRESGNRDSSRTVDYQLIFDERGLADATSVAALATRLDGQAQTRLAARLPVAMTLCDRTAALVPLDRRAATEEALFVRSGALLDALEALFETVWQLATPLAFATGRRGDELDEQDQALLSLLVGGLTDDAAGARLGMSRRTVARRVQRLMTVTGARSRLQLGWWARERQWL